MFRNHLKDYPTPSNITYMWSFGSIAGICLVIQIITGVFLVMHYTPHISLAFDSIEHIMRDVNFGWWIRYIHANGASLFFIFLYLHLLRGLYYGSYMYPSGLVWSSGVVLLILSIAIAFLGYVLPFGQMSYWGSTVITNMFTAIPIFGTKIANWLWGGFTVNQATLSRFFSFHYLFPFILAALVLVHLALLHKHGSNNVLGIDSKIDKIPFYPYLYIKDLVGIVVLGLMFTILVFYMPNYLGHTDNYIEANSLVTPAHITPEWYLLYTYAILRSIPNKIGGIVAMISALGILALLPLNYLGTGRIRSAMFRPYYRKFYWLFVAVCLLLGWIGQKPAEMPYIWIGQIATMYYFGFMLYILFNRSRFPH